MEKQARRTGGFKAKAFQKAAEAVALHSEVIHTAEQAQRIKGVGASSAAILETFLRKRARGAPGEVAVAASAGDREEVLDANKRKKIKTARMKKDLKLSGSFWTC